MFSGFKKAVQAQFALMSKHPLYRVAVDKDLLWQTYLASFPEGTNPIWKERTEHDCNCCKSFIRAVGNMVAIIDGKVVSLWDLKGVGTTYQPVTDALAELIKSCKIDSIFLHAEKTAGVDKHHVQKKEGGIETFEHFYLQLPKELVLTGESLGTQLGNVKATRDVMLRSLNEITVESIETVLELIAQNSIYRGQEHKFAVDSFGKLKAEFDKLPSDEAKELFCWAKFKGIPESVSKIRGTVIGSLLTDLSEGKTLEGAVKAFEVKVAPANYKRPTALVTKGMVEKARATVADMGYTDSLERRYATLRDVSVNNVLFANRAAKKVMKDVFDEISEGTASSKLPDFSKCEEMPIEKFIADILPKVTSIELMVENRLGGNFMSLIAPVDPASKGMFKWPNNFSWSYAGEVADSMRERVVELGGRVDGALRFTHSWNHPEVGRNTSLMDLHVFMPGAPAHKDGCHDNYPKGRRVGWNARNEHASGGHQDVDYTHQAPENFIPIENISFPDIKRMPEGKYIFKIHNWQHRAPTTSGFKAEIEFAGQIFRYDHPAPLKNKEWVTLAEATLKNGVFTIEHKMTSQQSSVKKWNVQTQTFQKVSALLLSPNHWDGHGVGNKHYFFMVEGCQNDGSARGFFNEFLNEELSAHRKVFEVIGSKMKAADDPDQLSGIGFSSTQRNHAIVRVKGAFSRTLKLIF